MIGCRVVLSARAAAAAAAAATATSSPPLCTRAVAALHRRRGRRLDRSACILPPSTLATPVRLGSTRPVHFVRLNGKGAKDPITLQASPFLAVLHELATLNLWGWRGGAVCLIGSGRSTTLNV